MERRISTEQARELLVALVETPSPSGSEEAAAERLVSFFEAHGREVWRDAVGNVRAPADDAVLLTSHIDTVPGQIPVRIESTDDDELLWGRGSVDATGPLAAMATVAVRQGVSFVGVIQEETDSLGARQLIETRDAPDAVINGEPSGWDGITLGYRGMLSGTYVGTSESGHTSRPTPNAIEHALAWWQRAQTALEELTGDTYAPIFEQLTAKPVAIDGGSSDDGLSVEATMDVQFRLPPSVDADTVRERADGELEAGTVNWGTPIPPVMQSSRTSVARALRGGIRTQDGDPRLVRKTGTSDMNIYATAWDCPMATYGPGDSSLDHTPDEHLSLREYDRSITVLDTAVDRLKDTKRSTE